MIVWLASYPRSGNTLLRIALSRGWGIPTDSVYKDGEIREIAVTSGLFEVGSASVYVEELRNDSATHFVKTHEFPSDDSPAIYVIRDGRDAIVSFAHYLENFNPGDVAGLDFPQIIEKLILGEIGFGSWGRHVEAWTDRQAPTILLRYEQLMSDPFGVLQKALRGQFGLSGLMDSRPFPCFSELHLQDPRFFRRGRSGNWRLELSAQNMALFELHHGAMLERIGYRGLPYDGLMPLDTSTQVPVLHS